MPIRTAADSVQSSLVELDWYALAVETLQIRFELYNNNRKISGIID